jgi:perosamine synthetase
MEVDTLGVDVSSIPKNVKLKAAQLVHVYGQRARDTKKLADMCQKKGIKLIVDAAEAHGLDVRGVGDVVTYSLRSEKLVGIGEGGMICTDNPEIYANVLMYAERGIPSQGVRYWVAEVGCNYLMPNLPAAVGVAQMETLKDRIKKKREIAQWYREEMPEEQWVADPRTCDGVFWLNCLVLRENDLEGRDFIQAAYAEQVECRPGFYPLNMLPVGDSSQKCPTAAKIWRRLVCLPSSVLMDREDVRRVCRTFERITCRKSSWR